MSFIRPLKLNIAKKLEMDKKYRERFFRGQAQDIIAMSIRTLREKRSMRQSDLATESGIKQSAISRVEQAEYSAWTFKTLFRVANALDARLRITLEPMEDVIKKYKEMEKITEKTEPATSSDSQYTKIHPTGTSVTLICIDGNKQKDTACSDKKILHVQKPGQQTYSLAQAVH